MGCHSCRSCTFDPGATPTCKVLLIGNPNVGKSAMFSRLTGVYAVSSNYPGTTVGFTEGRIKRGDSVCRFIDVPGAYTLDATNEAEAVAARIVEEGANSAIMVLDATALERNLVLALEVLERGMPTVIALNMIDEARHKGIEIDVAGLEKELGVPVVTTVATTGVGISELVKELDNARVCETLWGSKEARWAEVGRIVGLVQRVSHRHHTIRDRIEDISVDAKWGILLGVAVLCFGFIAVRFIGESLIGHVFEPFFETYVRPLLETMSAWLGPGTARDMLIGRLFDGAVDFEQSFGLLSTGVYVEFAMVLPYIIAFYAVLGLLEDSGYLPRLAILFDALLHRVGIHGYAIIPTLLGLGCNVPGILATRVLESKRERFIAATLISVAIPCTALQAMTVGALGPYGMKYVAAVYGVMLLAWIIIGRFLHSRVPGFSPELIVEIPPYRIPSLSAWGMKLWLRIKDFLLEATPLVLGGILVINILDMIGVMDGIANVMGPLFEGVLGLPPKAAGPIVMGIFRKDVAVGLLLPLGLSAHQMLVAVVMLSMTFPCVATMVVLFKELGVKDGLKSTAVSLVSALSAGAMLRGAFYLFG